MKVLILGASYGSLLSTKLLMAGHDVTLICRSQTAKLINANGTHVSLRLRGEEAFRDIHSVTLPGKVTAEAPDQVNPADFDIICLAMQEPQYSEPSARDLMGRVAASKKPCLSIMNMPPLPYLRRINRLSKAELDACYSDPSLWADFEPGLMSLCSPDPQAFRPAGEPANVLHVGLPTNFKASAFADANHTALLRQLETDIAAITLDGHDVPVKLRVYDSLFVPLAKWSMLLTGNFRCILPEGEQSIRDAVLGDVEASQAIYHWVDALSRQLGAEPADQVPFEKYRVAANSLSKPSSGARAVGGGAKRIERIDRLVQMIGTEIGKNSEAVDAVVAIVDARLKQNALSA